MSLEASSADGPFHLEHLRQLVELMHKFDLNEVKLQSGDERVVLRRGAPVPAGRSAHAEVAAPAPPPAAAPQSAPATPAAEESLTPIKSPTVGTFYQSTQPGEPPFVKPGDKVRVESIVCIIEAMKVFNQIPAKVAGTIIRVLVKDGDPVEFGQPLFLVKD